ncbi:MAG: histone deacetylase family protein [Acidimicrobiales bacterium]|nr:MAG: histone deacetylase family protein [Acidimicrobiales bacterium]
MKVVRSDDHRLHFPHGELSDGELVRPYECPERWDHVVAALNAAGMTDVVEPEHLELDLLLRVHDPAYVAFLRTAWTEWEESGRHGDMIPTCFPTRRMAQHEPLEIDGRLGYFSFAAETAITDGTWKASIASAAIAKTAQKHVSAGESAAFALCRPPGHHAGLDYFGGYCFINNAAIAAQGLLDDGAKRVAVLDIDFHHGNGTQDIFYNRSDVFFASIHGDPLSEFPYFSGFKEETGAGAGDGATRNYPLLPGTTFQEWVAALDQALREIDEYGAEALVVSLGVDTFADDPISSFRLATEDFLMVGRRIGRAGLPTVYCMEGGYAVEEIGTNTVNVLIGHEDASP